MSDARLYVTRAQALVCRSGHIASWMGRSAHDDTAVANVFSSKADVAYHELRRLILNGGLPAGSRLAQYELAERWV